MGAQTGQQRAGSGVRLSEPGAVRRTDPRPRQRPAVGSWEDVVSVIRAMVVVSVLAGFTGLITFTGTWAVRAWLEESYP
jgi:hypothetical protein